jgi:hypothetical protein
LSRTTKAAAIGRRASSGSGFAPPLAAQAADQAQRLVHRAPAAGQRQHLVAPQVAEVGACPHGLRRAPHRPTSGPRTATAKSSRGCVGPAVVDVVAVVDDVDAAHEGHVAVDHAQLLVQPAQLAGHQPAPPAVQRAEDLEARCRAPASHCAQPVSVDVRAEAVDHHAHRHAALAAASSASATARPAPSS